MKCQIIAKKLLPCFSDQLILAITPSLIERYRDHRRQDLGSKGITLKVATVNRDLALLKHLFNFALREGWLDRNPVSMVKLEKENTARDRVLSPEEIDRLLANSAPHLQAINLIAYQTGMRSGEIQHLTWDRVDQKEG